MLTFCAGRTPPTADELHAASPYTTSTQRRRSSAAGLKRKSSTLLPALPTSRSEQLCAAVRAALEQHAALRPLALEVQDASCAQLQYRLLGSRKYWYRSVKQEKQGARRWEAKLYEVRCRKSVLETVERLHWGSVAQLSSADSHLRHVGFFDSEKAAATASEAAAKARDVTNPFTGSHTSRTPLPDALVTFVQVLVVCESFQRRSQRERLRAVYEALLTEEQPLAVCVDAPWAGADLRGFSGCVGANVARLPLWRFLALHVRVVALTPTQWRLRVSSAALVGDTERLGPSHIANDRALGVNVALLPVSRGLAELVAPRQEDSTKSVLPHFYHGLPDELKRMIAEQQAAAAAGGGGGSLQRQLQRNSEATVVKKFLKRRRELVQAALKLQRAVRTRSQRRVLREIFARQRSALAIQRLVRGHRARRFARAYYRVMTCAALIVQSVYRSHVSRAATHALRLRMCAAALTLQRVQRGHVARKFVRWVRHLDANALRVQRVARGFVARRRVTRIRAARYRRQVVVPSAVRIQRVYRGHRARMHAAAKRALREKLEVLHPAAVRVGRLLRGFLARRLATRFRAADVAARRLQRFWRAVRHRRKWTELLELRRRDRLASVIGALGRAFVARKFVRREQRRQHLRRVLQPAAVAIQRVFRGHVVRRRVETLRDETEAAVTLQQMWRRRLRIRTIDARLRGFRASLREASAAQIQRCFRCHRARAQLLYRKLAHQARYGTAVVAIQAAWRSHRSREQLRAFRFCARLERTASALTQWKEAREAVELDMLDARGDLQRVARYKTKSMRRIRELRAMRLEWERRQPFVAKELESLTDEDVDRGWGEAFETEKHVLRFSLELSVEDILARKQQVREYDAELEDLRLELDDLERDLEECVASETTELESFRDAEVAHARAMAADDRARKVRTQRVRWRVKSDRRNVVRRQREDVRGLEQSQLAKRHVQELGVLSFEKKQMLKKKLERAVEHAALATSHEGLMLNQQARDAEIVSSLNEGIERMKAIVDEHSFEFRVPKADAREFMRRPGAAPSTASMCAGCGRMTCDCDSRSTNSTPSDSTSGAKKDAQSSQPQVSRHFNRLDRRPRYQDARME